MSKRANRPQNNTHGAAKKTRRGGGKIVAPGSNNESTAANLAEFLSLLRNITADTLGELLPCARVAAGSGVPIKYHAPDGLSSKSALLIITDIPGFRSPAPLSQFRGTIINWNSDNQSDTRIVAYPPPALVENASITSAVKNLDNWTITPMDDATVITMYKYCGAEEWKLASTRGIDVSDHYWMDSGITFREALNECLPEGFSYKNLDPDWCYTIGFHHHKLHPFMNDPQHARLLQAAKTAGVSIPQALTCATIEEFTKIATNIGLMADNPVTLADLPPPKLKSWMILNNKHALNNYVQAVHRSAQPPIHYGYILRRKGPGEGPSNISLPSSLFHLIKRSVYSFPAGGTLTADSRRKFVIWRACLSPEMKYNFLRLFPQWIPEYKAYESLLGSVAEIIVTELSRRRVGSPEWTHENFDEKLVELAKLFIGPVEEIDVNPLDSQALSIVTDVITSMDNMETLLAYTA